MTATWRAELAAAARSGYFVAPLRPRQREATPMKTQQQPSHDQETKNSDAVLRSELRSLLSPRTVAVIGASRRRGTIGGELLHNLLSHSFAGAVYPVNPQVRAVQGVRAWPSVEEVPDDIDLAVIAVPAAQVRAEVEACGRKGVKSLVVITAGFGELGGKGKELQDELVALVRRHGMRMVGPNCLGIQNRDPEVGLNATFSPAWPPPGGVAIASQSGALGQAILEHARDLGLGVHQFVSMGNKADLSGNDLLAYWGEDPAVKVILLYLESFGNPKRFQEIAKRTSRNKPVLMVKAGRSEAGAQAASSHTGAMAGLDVAVDALLGQTGVLRADTLEQLFDLAMLLANQPLPRGRRLAVLTNAGGPGIMATDACVAQGLQIPPLCEATKAGLRSFLPPEASVRNPVDMIASASAEGYRRAVQLLCADPDIDAVLAIFVPPIVTDATAVADAIREGAAGSEKPVVTCFLGKHGVPEALRSLRAGNIPSYAFPESAAIALAHAARYAQWLQRPAGKPGNLPAAVLAQARALVQGAKGDWLSGDEVRQLLVAVGIPVLPERSVPSGNARVEAVVAAAHSVGMPVALKIQSSTITHKSDVGGVTVGLDNPEEVRRAMEQMRHRLSELDKLNEVEGWLVQAMAPQGVECLVGATRDPVFGPLVAFGSGGIAVEVWRDVAFRLAPLDDVDAAELLGSIRGAKLLDGFRGAPPADRAALIDVLLKVGQLVDQIPEIAELDLNPLLALAPGQGVLAVDARVRIAR
ncbi:MAG: acetate--CoA ligase family protein [Deltaproteobacteria bacterium]|nr:acetate--CoA ligase family protein [Deltaproteobacteria bacterium]